MKGKEARFFVYLLLKLKTKINGTNKGFSKIKKKKRE